MFSNKQKLQKIKCVITGQIKQCWAWYNCASCCINYSTEIFSGYDGWVKRPRCAMCAGLLLRKTISLFSTHRRR